MDKISLVSSFQKSVEALKNTECSEKEKLAHFANISDVITSPTIKNHPNQMTFISHSLAVLLMFCEEMDSAIHLNAEEHLNKIIRFCEKTDIVRIQYDLYHEIKKNGNERSLRICLNIFACYCHLIKQRKVKPYSTNFLPCIYAISKRKETQLLESLSDFLKTFCKFMGNCLSDRDIVKLIEVFLSDATSDCVVKRRCASQNVMTLIMNSKKSDFICRQAFTKTLDILTSDQSINAVIGLLGMLRLLIPELTSSRSCDFSKIIQILDVCLHLLQDKSHSIINASLEVILAILRCPEKSLKTLLTSRDHIEIIRRENSLRNLVFKKTGTKVCSPKSNEIDKHFFEMNSSRELEGSIFSKDTQILDEGCLSCTDIEMDSLISIDSTHDTENSKKKSDTTSLKSQKSTESFGSFFNLLLSQSKPTGKQQSIYLFCSDMYSFFLLPESVTKFFRSSGSSVNNTPKKTQIEDSVSLQDFIEDDAIPAESLGSNVSIHSRHSSTDAIPKETEETVTVIETEVKTEVEPEVDPEVEPLSQASSFDNPINCILPESIKLDDSTEYKEMSIGSIYDQYLVEYIVRLVSYKFLLNGQNSKLKLDSVVRVSIKNLSLLVLSYCVRIYPQIMLMKLSVPQIARTSDECDGKIFDDFCLEDKPECKGDEFLLDIKADHFGKSSCSLDEFLSPLIDKSGKKSKTVVSATHATEVTTNVCEKQSDVPEEEKFDQNIEDVVLYFNHHDPSLRGNVQSIIGNFIAAVLEEYKSLDEFRKTFCSNTENKFINLNLLLKVLMKGLSDEIHTVVKHSLHAIDILLPLALPALIDKDINHQHSSLLNAWKIDDLNNVSEDVVRIDQILDELFIIGSNKNWVVQNKYCELISNIDFNEIKTIMGDELAWYYENKFIESIYSLIGDQDVRTRARAVQTLCRYAQLEKEHVCSKNIAISDFVCARIFNKLPLPFENFKNESSQSQNVKLGRVLYTLTNKLMELDDRNQLFGVINAIAELVKVFNPIKYHSVWNEFHIIDVCLNYMRENYLIGTDATCQGDMLTICTSLISGNAFDLKYIWSKEINDLLLHVLKLLNIFYHVFNNIRPVYIPKGQKNDIFISTKEFQLFENFGYFGNDYFYRKLYKLMRQSYDSYKITIARDVGQIIMDLLRTTLNSFIVILDIKIPEPTSNPIKLIEESLMYLSTLINYAPMESVIVIRQLLKYMFSMNLRSRTSDFEFLARNIIENECSGCDISKVTTVLRSLSIFSTSATGENVVHILLFKPIVIRCLKIFSKSDTSIQSAILDMLCQALDFNVNYSLLDSNNVFLDFVLKLAELIETGVVRESEIVVPSIIKFLFCLTKEKERNLITIPKIINITDTLLANDAKSGSSALNELAFKFFFDESVCDDAGFSVKDINTQKEVALRMLIKFLHVKEIQNSLCIILLLQRLSTDDNENSFYVNLLQVIDDTQELFLDVKQFDSVDLCFKAISDKSLMEESNLRKTFTLFYRFVNQREKSIEVMSVISILIENVMQQLTEETVLKQTQQYLQERIESTTTSDAASFFSETIFEFIKFAIESLYCSRLDSDVCDEYKQHTSKLFRMLVKNRFGVGNFQSIKHSLSIALSDADFIINSIKKLHSSYVNAFIEFLFLMNCDWLPILHSIANCEDTVIGVYVPNIFNALCTAEQLREAELEFILNHLDTFVNTGLRYLLRALNDSKHLSRVIDRMYTLMGQQLSKETQQSIFTLVSSSEIVESYPKIIEVALKFVKTLTFTKCQSEELVLKRLSAMVKADTAKKLPNTTFTLLRQFCENEDVHYSLKDLVSSLQQFYGTSDNVNEDLSEVESSVMVDGSWLIEQINYKSFNTNKSSKSLAELLFEITSEKQLSFILSSKSFNICHLHTFINFSFDFMQSTFKQDCMQYNPHLNYLKIPLLLKHSMLALLEHVQTMCSLFSNDFNKKDAMQKLMADTENYRSLLNATIAFLSHVDELEHTCLAFIELKSIEKFFKQNILKEEMFETFVKFATICTLYVDHVLEHESIARHDIEISLRCADLILRQKLLWNVINSSDVFSKHIELVINVLYKTVNINFGNTKLMSRFEIESMDINRTSDCDKKAIFLAKFVEIRSKNERKNNFFKLEDVITSLIVSVLRTNKFYVFAIAPIEVLRCDLDIEKSKLTAVPSIPIEYLNEADVLELFIKRIQIFGYTCRHQFEEFFMSLLLLFNTEVEIEIVDSSEQFQIRNMCMLAITELLLSLKVTTNLGSVKNKFHHLPRGTTFKLDSISRKKLHKVLLKLPDPHVFYLPNGEHIGFQSSDDITSTSKFSKGQMDLNCVWQIVEEMDEKKMNLSLRNSLYLIESSEIDLRSSLQLIFDVFGQLIDINYSLILPHLLKLSEICENRDQYRWIKNISSKLQESVPLTNVIAHQSIIYCLCKPTAILIPSLSELTSLCSLVHSYLKSPYISIRNATLKGSLCLLESCVKTNTTIGSLSEELSLIRNVVTHYTNNNGIVEESKFMYSAEHTKLVWVLNLYLIETTSKFVNDINSLSNTVISANNILKRTNNIDQYLCILHGLQRIVVCNIDNSDFNDKIEQIALHLFKSTNEAFSIPALKLLITCLYISSNEQLKNTEISNGIVQDEPEVILQSTERIDILFQRIKYTTPGMGEVFGNVLCQMIRDLVPPNEILTKVIKEFLSLNQPQCEVIAKILFHVFRSAIDSDSLTLLQDWLICSFPNFLMFPVNRAIWCLSVIFVSASINQYLVKIFPEVLDNFNILNDRQVSLFRLFTKDFFSRLSGDQRLNFKKVLSECSYPIIKTSLN
ncbi:Huntingtin [Pseudolycoriella hygida]|uniref:Huntingtin n=1 Tax=Pseudolycoriella hygida TaxID=35572 RepID=A0A9Q0MTJ0_9DIPT|nr:Huntingtin [Pseudolycoriella hygida]